MKQKVVTNGLIVIVVSVLLIIVITLLGKPKTDLKTEEVAVRSVDVTILADGQITSQNEAKLQFLTGGRLKYLPFKEGSHVLAGQTVASLDTYALQRQVQIAANAYQTTKNSNDQVLENKDAGVLEGQQRVSLDTTSRNNSYSNTTEAQVISDAVERIVNSDLLAQNTAQMNVDLANYAVQLATLTSPIDGIVTHEDVTVPNVNVTPATTFVIDDPNTIVLRAQVSENDIDFVSEGSTATISLNGNTGRKFSGTVVSIHPQKVTLTNGQSIYYVDVASDDLKAYAKFGQTGSVQIQSNTSESTKLVPTWTILNREYIWVDENGARTLKQIKTGKTHGSYTEVLSGLSDQDTVVVSPKSVISNSYHLL